MKYSFNVYAITCLLTAITTFAPLTERVCNQEQHQAEGDLDAITAHHGINIICDLTQPDQIIFHARNGTNRVPITLRSFGKNQEIITQKQRRISIPRRPIHDQESTVLQRAYPSEQNPKYILYMFLWDQQNTIPEELTKAQSHLFFLINLHHPSRLVQYLQLEARTIAPDAKIYPDILGVIRSRSAQQSQAINQNHL
ncbi:MAG: hypothetical protein NTZ68_00100 [Candidatus Dependentiae bacterium]|nr:hypothetical protein [Candidatus Dependentiae bacterium]